MKKCIICGSMHKRNSEYCGKNCIYKAWYRKNKKYKNEQSRKWHLEHYVYKGRKKLTAEEKEEKRKQRYEQNKEYYRNYNREYYLKHKDDAAYKERKNRNNRAAYYRRKNRIIGG